MFCGGLVSSLFCAPFFSSDAARENEREERQKRISQTFADLTENFIDSAGTRIRMEKIRQRSRVFA